MTDVCIIGAGAAGLALAHRLAASGHSLVVLEGGSREPQTELEDTYRAEEIAGFAHRGIHEGRFRALGGTTTRWGGQLWPWEPYEFEPRAWVPGSGWPIGYAEVAPYYPAALSLLNVAPDHFHRSGWPSRGVTLPALDPDLFVYKFSKWAAWRHRNMGRTLGRRLLKTPGVTVRLETTAVELVLDPDGERVEAVRCRTRDGGEEWVRARHVVLCGGTIENARLLLASNSVVAEGIGNRSGWVGRGFMDHLSARVATVVPRDHKAFGEAFAPFYVDGVMHTPRMVLAPEAQAEHETLACYGHWTVSLPDDSGLLLLREQLRGLQAGRGFRLSRGDLGKIVASGRDTLGLAAGVVVNKRRSFPRDAVVHLQIDTEQAPCPSSRIRLGSGRDSLSLPRVVLDWTVSEAERRTVRRCAELLAAEIERLGLGEVVWDDRFASPDGAWDDLINDAYHPMGGTRMSGQPEDGVVDADGRVHGVENLFVAGASTFPTGGMANPTLTLIALALRLGDHLHQQLHVMERHVMEDVTLAPTGTTTSRLGLGMATLMREPAPRRRRQLLDTAYDAGFRHFDTAPSYGLGAAEATLAPFLEDRRASVTVATKFGLVASVPHPLVRLLERPLRALLKALPQLRRPAVQAATQAAGPLHHPTDFSVSNAAESVAQSLRALGTDYLDVLLLHEVRPEDIEDGALVDWLEKLRARGEARQIGLATSPDAAAAILNRYPGVFDVVQVPLNPLEPALPPAIADFGGTLIAHSVFNPTLAHIRDRAQRDPAWGRRFQESTGVDPSDGERLARLLMAFALHANPRGIVLVGASSPGHLRAAPSFLSDDAFDPVTLARLPDLLREADG